MIIAQFGLNSSPALWNPFMVASGLLNYLLPEYLSTVKHRQDLYLQIKLWNLNFDFHVSMADFSDTLYIMLEGERVKIYLTEPGPYEHQIWKPKCK